MNEIVIFPHHQQQQFNNDDDNVNVAMEWIYDDSNIICNNEKNRSGYWYLPNHINQFMNNTQQNCHKVSITYNQLFFLILDPLIKTLTSYINTNDLVSSSSTQPIVAICIPEGPYLPIAMLAIHIYNISAESRDHSCRNTPIILPLDPQEGEDRLKYMIKDAQPSFVLYVKNTMDGEKLEKVMESIDQFQETNLPHMLDIVDLLEENCESKKDKSIFLNQSKVDKNRISHIVYTSGTTGVPKGTISSIASLLNYIHSKNKAHSISSKSRVFLASSLSFDPCLSDVIATFYSGGCLCFCDKEKMKMDLSFILKELNVTHVLCTPSLWSSVNVSTSINSEYPYLEVVALGGEVMSDRIKTCWARNKSSLMEQKCKLLSTYGVTEACVYQTVCEVFIEDENVDKMKSKGYDIGLPLDGVTFSIRRESSCDDVNTSKNALNELLLPSEIGEIVLSGIQLDEFSGYLNLPELTEEKFISTSLSNSNEFTQYSYRTGDRGLVDPISGHLHILGRIDGEEGMVKINGVRVELGEIEHAILDNQSFIRSSKSRSLVTGCVVVTAKARVDEIAKIIAYCVLSDEGMKEIGHVPFKSDSHGLICPPGSLLTLLRARCIRSIRKECIPSTFVLIPRIPLTRTGKRNKQVLPSIENCQVMDAPNGNEINNCMRLDKYGRCGRNVFKIIIECLNLQPLQQDFVTTKASFEMLGGDSLTATLVVRSLYAIHHEVNNTRYLGGEYGSFDGPFNVSYLQSSRTLGQYVDFLDSSNVMTKVDSDGNIADSQNVIEVLKPANTDSINNTNTLLYDALIEAITFGRTTLAIGLLAVGADPNHDQNNLRLGKLKNGRQEQKKLLKSNPLHLACAQGNKDLVRSLLDNGCKSRSPDANGQYALHLACSGSGHHPDMEDKNRLECVLLLLKKGNVPLSMKNASKQTVLHCAARAGHCRLLSHLMNLWSSDESIKANKLWGESKFDWQDRWFRTPVHWAVLNGHVSALKLLLTQCSSTPPLPKKSQSRSSVAIESPLEMCDRLYEAHSEKGKQIRQLLSFY